jgi:leucyl aminopeptidase (aminopeptidase T)
LSTQQIGSGPEPFQKWIPLARQVVKRTLALRWKDVLDIYSYIPTIPVAEALALEARRAGSDTHIELMTDDLWFTSMTELPERWLREPSTASFAINRVSTAHVYLGGPVDARRMVTIPPERFDANAIGGMKQDAPLLRRCVKFVDLSIGRVCPERAEAYGLDYPRWRESYETALAVDLDEIQKAGNELAKQLIGRRKVHLASDSGTDLRLETKATLPFVDDGIIDNKDLRQRHFETSLPAGKVASAIVRTSAEGDVHFAEPIFFAGRAIKGTHFTFKKGKLVRWEAEENGDLLNHPMRSAAKEGADRLGWFAVGLNSAAKPCMLDNRMVKDDVTIGLGHNPQLEPGKKRTIPEFDATIGVCHLEVSE